MISNTIQLLIQQDIIHVQFTINTITTQMFTISSNQSNSQRQNEDNFAHQIQRFLIQALEQCEDYDLKNNLTNRTCPLHHYYRSYEHYQNTFQTKLQRSNLIAVGNDLIGKAKYQKAIKVLLRSQPQNGLHERRVFLKAVDKSDQISLEEQLIQGRMFCIITRAHPFLRQNLKNNTKSTHLCFIGKVNQFEIAANGLERLQIPPSTTKQWEAKPLEEEAPLRHNEYYLIKMRSIISEIRECNAVTNCQGSPLIEAIILNNTRKSRKQEQHQETPSFDQKKFLTKKGQKNRKKLDKSQAEAVKIIGSAIKGLFLIQGTPASGISETIVRIAINEVQRIRESQTAQLPGQQNLKSKVMICTTSNAEADRLAQRLYSDAAGYIKDPPKILRVFHAEQVDEMHLSFNFQHQREIRALGTQNKPDEWTATLRLKKKFIKEVIKQMKAEGKSKGDIKRKRQQISEIEEKIVKINYEMSKKWQKLEEIEKELMEESDIIILTLNTAGRKSIAKFCKNRICCLLIDGANQATETSTLIPFATLVEKVVLAGNLYQLKPQVKTKLTAYGQSLFQRLAKQKQKNKTFALKDQYRMTKEIMEFPNKQFYKENLICKIQPSVPQCLQDLKHKSMFFDVTYGVEEPFQGLFINRAEAQCILTVIEVLTKCDKKLTIGVISAYKQQVKHIQSKIFGLKLQKQLRKNVRVDTIEGFQGQQMDFVIFSTVRTNSNKHIRPLHDKRRLNLAFTRAKGAFFVFGSAKTLSQSYDNPNYLGKNQTWQNYLDYHQDRNSLHAIQKGESKTFFS